MGLKWCKLHDLPEPCDKCQAKTPDDVRKALAKIVYKYSYEPEPFTEFKQALEDFIKPLIEAAKTEERERILDLMEHYLEPQAYGVVKQIIDDTSPKGGE